MDKNETLSDIIAKMRRGITDLRAINPHVPSIVADWLEDITNCIEAAARRAYNEIDSAVCAIKDASHLDIYDVRNVMERTIGDYDE